MIMQIVPAVFVIFIALTIISIWMGSVTEQKLAYEATAQMAMNYANGFDASIGANQLIGRTLSYLVEGDQSASRNEISALLKGLVVKNSSILGAYVGYEPNAFDGKDAEFVNQTGSDATGRFIPYWNRLTGVVTLDPLLDYETSDYYLVPKRSLSDSVIEPYVYEGVLMASYISPILNDAGQFEGIAGVDVSLNYLDSEVSKIKPFDSGYAFLVSNSTIFVSAPDKTLIGTKTLLDLAKEKNNPKLTKMAEDIRVGKSGYINTNDPFTGKAVTMFYTKVNTGNWGFVVVAPDAEMLAGMNQMRVTLIVVGIIGLLIMVAWIWFVSNRITRPIVRISEAANQIASGDLALKLQVQDDDEIGVTVVAFNKMVAYLNEMAEVAQKVAGGDLTAKVRPQSAADILGTAFALMLNNLHASLGKVDETAQTLLDSSRELALVSKRSDEATRQISVTIQQVTKGIGQQAEAVSRTVGSVDQMTRAIDGVSVGAQAQGQAVVKASQVTSRISQAIDKVATNVKAVTRDSAESARYSREGAQTVKETITGMETIRTKVGFSARKVEEMGARSGEIGAIVETIEDIASQTNLLALNAAIEAARAGEQGKGFAVVADEVRKLAERSSLATKEIAGLIKGIQKTVGEAVLAMDESGREVEAGVARANTAGVVLTNILGAAESVYKQAEEAGSTVAKVSVEAGELVNAVDAVSAVVEQNTATTQQMAVNSSQLTQAMENIASVSEQNNAAVEEVSASTAEVATQVQDVTKSVEGMTRLAEGLRDVVKKFKL
jgi:methyl-accepting chemotaxis protein